MAIGARERDRDGSAALIDNEVYLRSELSPIGGILAGFLASQRGRRALGIHRLPSPSDPIALLGVVLGHPFHQLLEDAHPSPSLKALVDDTRGDPEPIPMNRLPLATGPKHVPDSVNDSSVGCPRSATFCGLLPLLFGQALLDFSPQGSRKTEVIHLPGRCGSLAHKAYLLRE